MQKSVLLLLLLTLVPIGLWAKVEEAYSRLQQSEFYKFFRIKELERIKLVNGMTFIRCEPGANDQFIDLEIILNKENKVAHATLYVNRNWIAHLKNNKVMINPWGRDITKSFIAQFAHAKDGPQVAGIVKQIYESKETQNIPAEKAAYATFLGEMSDFNQAYSACSLTMKNYEVGYEKWFRTQVVLTGIEMPKGEPQSPVADNLFIGEKEMKPFGLKLSQNDPGSQLRAWANDDVKAAITRIVDIRWVFANAADAQYYHLTHLRKNSEASQEMPVNGPLLGQEFKVFVKGSDDPMLKAMGVTMTMYYFIFREDNILAKVFIAGNRKLTMQEAARFAKFADNVIKPKKK